MTIFLHKGTNIYFQGQKLCRKVFTRKKKSDFFFSRNDFFLFSFNFTNISRWKLSSNIIYFCIFRINFSISCFLLKLVTIPPLFSPKKNFVFPKPFTTWQCLIPTFISVSSAVKEKLQNFQKHNFSFLATCLSENICSCTLCMYKCIIQSVYILSIQLLTCSRLLITDYRATLAVSSIGRGNRSTRRKSQTCRIISSTPRDESNSNSQR